jgi:hypothetical protein
METARLAAIFVVATTATILNFRVAAAWRRHWLAGALRAIVSAIPVVAGVAVVAWGFAALDWYWAALSVIAAYVLAYAIFGDASKKSVQPWKGGPTTMANLAVPVLLDTTVLGCGVYVWAVEWPF